MEITNINDVFAMYYSSHHFDRGYSMVEYIRDEYDKEGRQELLNRLERCRCYKKVNHKPVDSVPENKKVACECRHWHRIISTLPDKVTKHFQN